MGLVLGIAKAGASAFQAQQAKEAERNALIEAGKLGKQIADRKFINKFAALQAPTKGTQLMMEQVARQAQAATEASKEAGTRGVIGGTGRTVQAVADAGAQIAARLDDLQLKLDNKFLTEEQRIGLMNEKKDLQLDYQRLQGAQGAATDFGTQAAQAQAGVISGLGEAVAGGIEASGLYKGDKETDTTTKDFVENDEYKPKLTPNSDMDSLEIAPPPAEYQLPQDESALVDPTQQSSAALVDPEEKGKQNKFVDFFRNIFGKDDYFSSLGVSKKTARMLRDENNF
ncbi:MAG: hypothetical protein CMJ25_02205 [Phycisphaerae bacterium]|nr:hypothetical protein [Phycisphaerae bacterium]